MTKPVTLPTVFGTLPGPNASTSLFDGNFNPLAAALNDVATYGNYYADTGGVNAIVATVAAPLTFAYTSGVWLDILVAATNTSTAVTINVNALGAISVVDLSGAVVVIGSLVAGSVYRLMYDGTKFRVLGSNLVSSISAKYKTSTTTRSSTVVLADDPDLIFTSVVAGSYRFEMLISPNNFTTNTQGLSLALSIGGTVSGASYALYDGIVNGATQAPVLFSPATGNLLLTNISTSTIVDMIRVIGSFTTTTAGKVALQWCQRSSSANFTAVQLGSYLTLTKLS